MANISSNVRPMVPSDIESIVDVHLQSFPGFFLTFLGRDFLALLYQNIQQDPIGILLVDCSDGNIQGFVAGVTQQNGFYRRLVQKNLWVFARATLNAFLSRPSIAPRLIRALNRSTEVKQSASEACLMSIAVKPEYEGKGIGRELVIAFCESLAGKGVKSVCLTTDREHNDRVNLFYQQLGFSLVRWFVTPEGRKMNEYLLDLPISPRLINERS